MYDTIMMPLAQDDGAETDKALTIAAALLNPGGKLVLIHVMEIIPSMAMVHIPEDVLEKAKETMTTMLAQVASRASGQTTEVLTSGHVGRTIVDYAEAHNIDCIVMRSHHPVISDIVLGSSAAFVVRHAGCSVHVMR